MYKKYQKKYCECLKAVNKQQSLQESPHAWPRCSNTRSPCRGIPCPSQWGEGKVEGQRWGGRTPTPPPTPAAGPETGFWTGLVPRLEGSPFPANDLGIEARGTLQERTWDERPELPTPLPGEPKNWNITFPRTSYAVVKILSVILFLET